MKLPSSYTDLCFKEILKNAPSSCNSCFGLVVNNVSCELQLLLNILAGSRLCGVTCNAQFTEGHLQHLKNTQNSITIENRTLIGIYFCNHKDLGNISCSNIYK